MLTFPFGRGTLLLLGEEEDDENRFWKCMTADLGLGMNDGAARRRATTETNSSNHERVNEEDDEVEEVGDAVGGTAMQQQNTAFERNKAKVR